MDKVVNKIKRFDEVQFVILYGSASENRVREGSDIDLCVGYDGDEEKASRFRYDILSELFADDYDIQIFQSSFFKKLRSFRTTSFFSPIV